MARLSVVNLKQLTTFDGFEVKRYRTRFVEALSKRARAEELQRRYPRMWRYNSRILNRVRSLHRRSRNIVVDWCWKAAKKLTLKAFKLRHAIVLESLDKLLESANSREKSIRWKLARFAYRRLIHSIVSKALEYNIPIVVVDPRNTSSLCPRCRSRLVYINRLAICIKCRLKMDRDSIGATNIWLKAMQAYAGVPGSPQSAPAMKSEARQSGGTRDEGMKKVFRSTYK
ncbi:MAG: zinc ribbon domain-containing protein [Desulfurococcus sp.]|uniref:IS200/IS605 family accessory protein TnpB-related protein n=1 Tax=Desulfurococcus sp. TaxID=51678 RepID=UPI0031696D71